jgi:electron transport complex protein RnfB
MANDSRTHLNDLEIYLKLQEHLNKVTICFPHSKSGVEIRLLKYLFTPKEAKIATMLKFAWKELETLENIFERAKHLGYTIEELEDCLDRMARKGAIMALKKGKTKTYGNANFIVGMADYQVNKLTKEFVKDSKKYLYEAYLMDLGKITIPQTRIIPIEQKIEPDFGIINYDDFKDIFDKSEPPYMVTNCVCRQGCDILGQPCKITKRREVCISFGHAAQRYIEQGWGRQITKEETLEILRKNHNEGLIHQINNAQKPDFICSCCTCCCEGLKILKSLPNPGDLIKTNYYAQIDPELCKGCGTCIDHCQMEAISVKDEISTILKKRCIGCGYCINICPTEAIRLHKKDTLYVPPLTGKELYEEIIKIKEKIVKRELKRSSRK